MKFITLFLLAILMLCAAIAEAQNVATPSHIERFSTTKDRAERDEAETSAKLHSTPNDDAALSLRANARMRLGRYAEAYEDLRRAVQLKPLNAEYQASLGYTLYKLGRPQEALAMERAAVKLDDKNFTANFQLGRFLLLSGEAKNLPEAATLLRRALELDPRRSEVRFDLLTAYRLLGDLPNAIAQLNLLQDARPADARVIYADALLASDRGDMKTAISSFQQALAKDPNLFGAWQDLGIAYLKQNQWPQAVETFAELAKRRSDSVEAAYLYALSLHNTGRSAEAEREVRRALRMDAGAAAAHTLLGIILASRGGADNEAIEALTQATALDANSFDAQFYLGRVQYATKDYAAAAKALRAAVQLNPKNAEARFFLGTVLEANGDADEAFVEYQELVQLAPASAQGQTGLGALLVKQGKLDEAISALQKAIALDAKSFEAHWALGRAFLLKENYAAAINTLTEAVALLPDRADAHFQLGQAYQRAGRKAEAAREFETVKRINEDFRIRTKP
ncbi:MAG: tetratricopeptide repeat protein [Acidobacteria bacterium]|nr:tetratricopeptide repeat protein [Acidobacteriota bacterium]